MTVTDADDAPHEIMVYTMTHRTATSCSRSAAATMRLFCRGCLDAGISPQQFYDADEKYRKAYKARAAPCPKKHAPER